MKLGLILECGPDGPDKKVLHCLFRKFAKHIEPKFVTESGKISLFNKCGKSAKQLFADGCVHVMIVWDLYPADWSDPNDQQNRNPCFLRDCRRVFTSLEDAGVNKNNVSLNAIDFMLESWLLADKRAIANFLSKASGNNVRTQRVGNDLPHSCSSPKTALSTAFKRCGYRATEKQPYKDFAHAHRIAEEISSLDDLNQLCPTFRRFWKEAYDLSRR